MNSRKPIAWVSDERERLVVEQALRPAIGRRIEAVRYAEIAYEEPPKPAWPGPTFDSVGWGLELDLDARSIWSVAWEQVGDNEGIVAYPGWHENLRASGSVIWDVTDHWRERGPREIEAITPVWQRPYVEAPELCLVTLTLTAANGRQAVITLGEREPDGSFRFSGENLAVFFSTAAARAAGAHWTASRSPIRNRRSGPSSPGSLGGTRVPRQLPT